MISRVIKAIGLSYPPQPSTSVDNANLVLDNFRYHVQTHSIIRHNKKDGGMLIVKTFLCDFALAACNDN